MLDYLVVQGQGTTESLKVAGRPPGPGSSLRFKMTESLLKDCTEGETRPAGAYSHTSQGLSDTSRLDIIEVSLVNFLCILQLSSSTPNPL